MRASRRQERRADEIELGWVVITKHDLRHIRARAMRVDKITKNDPEGRVLLISGPGVYVNDPDTFLGSMKTQRETLVRGERVLRILPEGHPHAR